jgi:hypothetical protein
MTIEEYEEVVGQHPSEEFGDNWEEELKGYSVSDFYCPVNNCGNAKGLDDEDCGDRSSH